MIYLHETTVWDLEYDVPNHTYIVTDTKEFCVGYIKFGTTEEVMFAKPVLFDTRRRKFKILRSM